MDVDQRVVPQDGGVVGRDEPHTAHVSGQGVHMVDAARGQQALVEAAEVSQLELVGVDHGVLGNADVHPPHPVTSLLQRGDEVVADEAAGSRDQDARTVWGSHLLLLAGWRRDAPAGRGQARGQACRRPGLPVRQRR
jgi:hypothetical protein